MSLLFYYNDFISYFFVLSTFFFTFCCCCFLCFRTGFHIAYTYNMRTKCAFVCAKHISKAIITTEQQRNEEKRRKEKKKKKNKSKGFRLYSRLAPLFDPLDFDS